VAAEHLLNQNEERLKAHRDTTGAVLIGAKVTAGKTATGTVSTSITTAAGEFTIPDLPVGAYTLQVTMKRFQWREWSAT
jgi:Carboxypeptidase regulatory-like domain